MKSCISELVVVVICLPNTISIQVYIGFTEKQFIKYLWNTFVLWSIFPNNPSFPSLVTLEIVLSVPE